jgi:hypothetical protein
MFFLCVVVFCCVVCFILILLRLRSRRYVELPLLLELIWPATYCILFDILFVVSKKFKKIRNVHCTTEM